MHRLQLTVDGSDLQSLPSFTPERADAVSRLALQVCDSSGSIVLVAAEFRAVVAELAAWATANAAALLRQQPPSVLAGAGSLAARIAAFYRSVDPDDVVALDTVYRYREQHGLRFALGGTDLPDIYMGLNGTAQEISCAEGTPWSYPVDLSAFIAAVAGTVPMPRT
jgi:hypothetical protein